ncbi:WRC [Musa troglodytarum]|uniref:WRC n=1 Tax=Musa troglodytarum TaxID=320322 RepID=A0A9E7FFS0_9LILI|nr:WRC [Musa troglodytarum]
MRIRKRPNPSSFPSSYISRPPPPPPPVPSLLPDPSSYVHPTAGKDGTPDNSGGGYGGRGGERLHSDGDLNIDPSESGNPPRPDQPHGSSSEAAGKVLRKDVKADGMVDSNEGWNTHVNSNCSSPSAPVSAWEQLGDAAISQKKKRGGDGMDIEKKPKGKGRAKTSDTPANGSACTRVDASDNGRCQSEDKEEGVGWMDGNGSNGKKRRSPAVLMEGSRCSRVNGRGWRCCQQTLVGYSLCEHHLGKGRLRSMASVRGQLGTSTGKLKRSSDRTTALSKPFEDKQPQPDDADETKMEDDKEKPAAPKRKKIGMVKARRISSLLDEINRPLPSLLSQPPEDAFMRMPDGSEAMV